MVVLVDLDDDILHDPRADTHAVNGFPNLKQLHHSLADKGDLSPAVADNRPNPNINGFSAALSCYPIVSQLASLLDLNSLHDLSRTCRQFRANLLEYRDQLVKNSLHCVNEDAEPGAKLADRLRQTRGAWLGGASILSSARITSGKIGKCARDMVGECQRCGDAVCRNCTAKPPTIHTLRTRHRRLCRTCAKAPIHLLMCPPRPRSSSSPPPSPQSMPAFLEPTAPTFTTLAFQRGPCSCNTTVWLCQPCSQQLLSADTMYARGWTWRTKYSHYLGGVGTGAGEGNEAVECGRGPSCLAARTVEHEIDCDPDTLAVHEDEAAKVEAEGAGRSWKGTSYMVQEIEGIGGVVKKKLKKQVLVGQVVRIYEDEKDRTMSYLEKENAGKLRSWCRWCERAIPGQKDLEEKKGKESVSEDDAHSSSSSTSAP